jgi:hypothetical protein
MIGEWSMVNGEWGFAKFVISVIPYAAQISMPFCLFAFLPINPSDTPPEKSGGGGNTNLKERTETTPQQV